MPSTANEREREQNKPKLQSDGAGARDGGKGTRNGTGEPGRDKPWPFRAGQYTICKVLAPLTEGYLVKVPGCELEGYIQTKAKLQPMEEIMAQIVCVSQGRVLLSAVFLEQDIELRTNQAST